MISRKGTHQADAPRVALVHDHLVQEGGAEQVLRVLMRMWPEAPVYTFVYDRNKMGPDFRAAEIRASAWQRLSAARHHYRVLLPLFDRAFRRFDLSGFDLVISSASGFAKSVCTLPTTLHVCYCHTPIRYLWDDSDTYIANLPYSRPVKSLIRYIRPRLRAADLRGARGVDEFVANSAHVADRIRRHYCREATVIHPPVEIEKFAPSRERGDYFLIATRLRPYKRVDLAIAAANELAVHLKVVGSGAERQRLEAMAGPTVEFTGRVSDGERKRLYGAARAFLAPQEEDFGLTAVEALASGTPVIAYGKGGGAEIVEHGITGLLFAEQSRASLVAAIRELSSHTFDPDRLRRRATAFSEAAFERRFRDYIDEARRRHRSRQQ